MKKTQTFFKLLSLVVCGMLLLTSCGNVITTSSVSDEDEKADAKAKNTVVEGVAEDDVAVDTVKVDGVSEVTVATNANASDPVKFRSYDVFTDSTVYDDYDFTNISINIGANVEAGDKFFEIVDQTSDLAFSSDSLGINKLHADIDISFRNELMKVGLNTKINDKDFLDAQVIGDSSTSKGYLQVPDINTTALCVENVDGLDGSLLAILQESNELIELEKEYLEMLNNERLINILSSYYDVATDDLGYRYSSREVTINDVSSVMNVKRYVLTDTDAKEISIAVLEKFASDSEMRDFIRTLFEYATVVNNAQFGYYEEDVFDFDEVYDEALAEIDNLIDEFNEEETTDEAFCELIVYADSDNYFSGLKIVPIDEDGDSDSSMSLIFVEDGNDIAFDFSIDGETMFDFVGEDRNNKISGELGIYDGSDSLLIGVEDFVLSGENVNLTLVLDSNNFPQLTEQLGDIIDNPVLKFTIGSTVNNLVIGLECNDGNEPVIKADITFEVSPGSSNIAVPSDFIDSDDEEALALWIVESIENMDSITNALSRCNVGDRFVQLIGMYITSFQNDFYNAAVEATESDVYDYSNGDYEGYSGYYGDYEGYNGYYGDYDYTEDYYYNY